MLTNVAWQLLAVLPLTPKAIYEGSKDRVEVLLSTIGNKAPLTIIVAGSWSSPHC